MGAMLTSLTFLNPWVLAGLLFLPALWLLLRVTPPAPRLIVFPAARFVAGLIPDEPTTSRTPWWVLLLRLLILTLVLLALARPVLNPAQTLAGLGAVRVVIDNGWAAAQTWDMQMREAREIISGAGRTGREIHIMTTAPEPGAEHVLYEGSVTQAKAEAIIKGLRPLPWPADYDAAIKAIDGVQDKDKNIETYWLSHGLTEGNNALARALIGAGSLNAITPVDAALPVLLRPSPKSGQKLSVLISAPPALPPGTPATVNAVGSGGRILDSVSVRLDPQEKSAEATFDIPDALRNDLQQIRIESRKGSGAVLLLDDRFKRRIVGIITPAADAENKPLIDEVFYLHRALEPYATLIDGTVAEIVEQQPAVIVMANIGARPAQDLNALEEWVKDGGLLLRFAGANMTQGDNFLVPAELMQGGRALDGSLTWEKPVKLAPFAETSPLYGLPLPTEVTVRRQLLAAPVPGLEEKTWAALEDGTPLITADGLGDGLLILVHTTATPLWSDLAISGFFVDMLRRFIAMSGAGKSQIAATGALMPLVTLDGFGSTIQPPTYVRPIASESFDETVPGSQHPPGLYGSGAVQKSFNIGDRIEALANASFPAGAAKASYGIKSERDLMPYLLAAAFVFFLVDWLAMILLQSGLRGWRTVTAMIFVTIICTAAATSPVHAQDNETGAARYAGNIYLAYMRTGDAAVDAVTQSGLSALAQTLKTRTSVEPSGVVGLNPEQDELSFFPLIYWAVIPGQESLSSRALENVQRYIDHGGTIVFDTRDSLSQVRSPAGGGNGRNAAGLRALTSGLNVAALVPINKDHVLGKSFYLLDSFPGRYDGSTLWIEEQSANGRDGVSSIIVGGNDWAAAWASLNGEAPRPAGGPQQQEMAQRFGVNLVMYALTGNYKADQVHLPHILERLGQ